MKVIDYERKVVNALVDEIYEIIKYQWSEYANGKANGYLQSCQSIVNLAPRFDEELFRKVDKAWAAIIEWSQMK